MFKSIRPHHIAVVILLLNVFVSAEIPRQIAYQGVLTDSKGNVRPDGQYAVTFLFYDAASGGSVLWTDSVSVSTQQGMFGVMLGEKKALSLPFDKQYWLGVAVDGKETLPRVKLASAAYCLRADTANVAKMADSAMYVAGVAASNHAHTSLDASDGNPKNALSIDSIGNVGIGTSTPTERLSLKGNLSLGAATKLYESATYGTCINSYLHKFTLFNEPGTVQFLSVLANGNVGIGTPIPATPLHVLGTAIQLTIEGIAGQSAQMEFADRQSNAKKWRLVSGSNNHGSLLFSQATDGIDALEISPNGNVGIGMTSNTYKLSVAGNIAIGSEQPNNGIKGSIFSGATIEIGAADSYHRLILRGNANITNPTDQANLYEFGDILFHAGYKGTETNSMVIKSGGNVGIGTTTPGAKLQVNGPIWVGTDCYPGNGSQGVEINSTGDDNFQIKTFSDEPNPNFAIGIGDKTGGWSKQPIVWNGFLALQKDGGNVGIGTTNPEYALDVAGIIRGSNVSPSDYRWKKNINGISNAMADILKLNGITYEFKVEDFPDMHFPNGKQYGLIAQDVEKIIPELVLTDDSGWKSISYEKIVPLLIEAVKEQQKEIETLKKEIQEIKNSGN